MTQNNYPDNLQPENKDEISNYISVEAIRQLEKDKLNKQSIQKFYSNPPSHYNVFLLNKYSFYFQFIINRIVIKI